MKKLSGAQIKHALQLSELVPMNDVEVLEFVLSISEEYEEFFIILESSFKYNQGKIDKLQKVLQGEKSDFGWDFLSNIKEIKSRNSFFDASIFCLTHFKFKELADNLIGIFEFEAKTSQRILSIFQSLLKLNEKIAHEKRLEELKYKYITHKGYDYKPVRFITPTSTIIALECRNLKGDFIEYITKKGLDIPANADIRCCEEWTKEHRGLFGPIIRRVKKDKIEIVTEGTHRKLIFLEELV